MTFDATAFLRLDALQSLGASASGASFATSTGDILEVSCYGPGVFRLRVGPSTRPDYGLVVGRDQGVHGRAAAKAAPGRSPPATRRSRSRPRRCASGCCIAARRSLGSITDEHFRGWTRLPAFGRAAPGRPVDRGARARVGRAGVRPRREIRPAQQARAAHPLAGRRRARRQHRPRVQEHAVRVEPGHRQGRVGRVRPHAGVGHARRRASRLVAPLVRDRSSTTRRSISSCSPRDTPAGILDLYTQLTGRAPRRCRCGASACGCRAPTTRRRRKRRRSRRSCARARIPCDVLTLDGRAAWKVGDALRFRVGSRRAFPIRAPRSPRSRRTTCAICVWEYPYVSVHSPLFADLASRGYLLTTTRRRAVRVRLGHGARHEPVRQGADAAARERHRRFHASRRLRRGGATRTRRCSPTAST